MGVQGALPPSCVRLEVAAAERDPLLAADGAVEGSHSDPGTRRSRYQSAAGSASEVLTGLRAAMVWGYFREEDATEAIAKLDRLLGALWKLTH